METLYTELALHGSNNYCARTDTVFFLLLLLLLLLLISEVCDGTVSLFTDQMGFELNTMQAFVSIFLIRFTVISYKHHHPISDTRISVHRAPSSRSGYPSWILKRGRLESSVKDYSPQFVKKKLFQKFWIFAEFFSFLYFF